MSFKIRGTNFVTTEYVLSRGTANGLLPTFTTTTLPSPSPAGQLIYLSDINQIAVSDGTGWNYSTVSPSNEALYSDALISNAANFLSDNTFNWSPAFQLNVTVGPTTAFQTTAPSGAGSLPFSPAVVITAPIYYEVTYVSGTTPPPAGLQIAGGGAVTAGAYTPGTDYAFAITMEPASGNIIAQLGPQPPPAPPLTFLTETIEMGAPLTQGTTLGVWIDVPNNNVNYTYDGTLHTTDSVTGTNPISAPTDFNFPLAVTTSNLFSGSGVIPSLTAGSGENVSVKINIGQEPFVHNPQLMPGTIDWFGNLL